jgi:hypothetical protein
MEAAKLLVSLVGYLAWPVVALIVGLSLIRELKGGLLAKIVQPGGTIEYGGMRLTVAEETEQAKHSVEALGIRLETPGYAEAEPDAYDPKVDSLDAYEIVMTAWSDLAEVITQLAVKHDGWDDRRQVWSNVEILRDAKVIDHNTEAAVRSVQQARNSIRQKGEVSRETAKEYARTAYSLKKRFDELNSTPHSTQSSPISR